MGIPRVLKGFYYVITFTEYRGPGSSVGIATDNEMDGTGSNTGGDEILLHNKIY